FDHNAMDVLSLVTLMVHLARLFGGDLRLSAGDRLALGRTCEAEGRLDEAATHYEAALALELADGERREGERLLSLVLKRLGRLEEAAELWTRAAEHAGNRELYPLTELAMYHERVTRDFAAARRYTERALLLLERYHARRGYTNLTETRAALHKRRVRLDERIARAELARTRAAATVRRRGGARQPAAERPVS
ncbi:MAG TPA: hypothetical protein VFD32_10035, partial [Dehalococcoidia bacterium]|nr:hypothetical protein [Dehalococcoidia bacterium]